MTIGLEEEEDQAEPTEARARISRGKDTFFTMPALFTTTPVPSAAPDGNRFHSSSPANRKMTKCGMLLLER